MNCWRVLFICHISLLGLNFSLILSTFCFGWFWDTWQCPGVNLALHSRIIPGGAGRPYGLGIERKAGTLPYQLYSLQPSHSFRQLKFNNFPLPCHCCLTLILFSSTTQNSATVRRLPAFEGSYYGSSMNCAILSNFLFKIQTCSS